MKMFDENYTKNQFNHSVYFPPPHSHKTNNENKKKKTFSPNINFSLRILFVFAKLKKFSKQYRTPYKIRKPLNVNRSSSKNGGSYISLSVRLKIFISFTAQSRGNNKKTLNSIPFYELC